MMVHLKRCTSTGALTVGLIINSLKAVLEIDGILSDGNSST
jgi:hypothetical protein